MEWEFESLPPWIVATVGVQKSEYPWIWQFTPYANGITMGHYYDTARVVSDEASNSPQNIYFDLTVWKFYGDCDYSGKINLLDISYLIRYLYHGGPAPRPALP